MHEEYMIRTELDTMIKIRSDKIERIHRVLMDDNMMVDTQHQLRIELHRLKSEIQTIEEAIVRVIGVFED